EYVALLACMLWAASPFLIAHGRILHVDGLLTSWMSLSLLWLLHVPAWQHGDRPTAAHGYREWIALLGSGICAGMALLTKSPALILLPCAGVLLLWASPERRWRRIAAVTLRVCTWLGTAALVVLALWPAMWVAPWPSIQSVYNELIANGARPHPDGSFFLGRPVSDPGWLFYPIVLAWRSDPLTLIGLVLLPLALLRRRGERRYLLALGGFVLLFGALMSAGPKKFDRYLLPIWPAIELLAAAGLVAAGQLCRTLAPNRWRTAARHHAWLGGLGAAALC